MLFLRFKIETLEINIVLKPIYKRNPKGIQIPLSPLIKMSIDTLKVKTL
jgi:hypothetical protein